MSAFLKAAEIAPRMTVADLLGERPLVILAPHPDDETLGCGALLFDAATMGVPCTVICLSDGSRSHPNSASYPASRLAALRRKEFEAAVAILAPQALTHWLGHPDCGIPPDTHLAPLLPQNALVLASWGGDPHIDHQRTAQIAQREVGARLDLALAYYPIWGRFADQPVPMRRLRASAASHKAKRDALACHRSQMTDLIKDDPDGFVMEDWHQRHFIETEEIVIAP